MNADPDQYDDAELFVARQQRNSWHNNLSITSHISKTNVTSQQQEEIIYLAL